MQTMHSILDKKVQKDSRKFFVIMVNTLLIAIYSLTKYYLMLKKCSVKYLHQIYAGCGSSVSQKPAMLEKN